MSKEFNSNLISLCVFHLLIGIFFSVSSFSQQMTIKGNLINDQKSPIPFANLFESKTQKGVSADLSGDFIFKVNKGWVDIKITAIGYIEKIISFEVKSDTNIIFKLSASDDLLDEMVVSGTLNEISKRNSPIPIEVYSASYLNKVPSPGLLEATQNINGVRPQLNCAVCNTGDIHINGMEGPYTMVTIDGMPIVGGLSTVYGLQGIPNSLLQRVEVVKGPASTLYGSEAVAGLINVITKTIDCAPKLSLDISATSWQEIQSSIMFKYAENKKVRGIFAVDYHNYSNPIDNNGDNFTDLTLKDRISLFNKLSFKRADNKAAYFSARYLYEDRWGGEMQWNTHYRGGDSIYGESIYTERVELIGKYELPTKEKLMLSSSYSFHSQDSRYGVMSYNADQHIAFGQMTWHKKIGDKNNFVSGIAVRYNFYDDNTIATSSGSANDPVNWILPGIFVQDNINWSKKVNLLLGSRYDYHTEHGSILSPRANLKWSPTDQLLLRLGYGNGFRVVNVFSEDHAALTGAREVIFDGELEPERSNNINLNIEKKIFSEWCTLILDGSAFYTHFSNKIIPDFETNDNQIIYANLNGTAVSRGFTINTKILFDFPLRINAGATILDVYSNEMNESGTFVKEEQLFTEPYSFTWSASYSLSNLGLSLDYTGNVYGPMKLPLIENDFRSAYSQPFSIQNIKISKEFKNNISCYFGVRNLLNFTPPSYSILRAHDPFDKYVNDPIDNPNNYSFDPSYIYTSFQGINFFIGFKYTIF